MAKEQKKTSKKMPLQTSQQTNAYRQQVKQQKKIASNKAHSDMDKLNKHMQSHMNYFEMYKKQDNKTNFETVSYQHPLDSIVSTSYTFNPKTKKDHSYNKDNRPFPKEIQKYPQTSSQTYGWHAPIDTFPGAIGLKSQLAAYGDIFKKKPQKK